MTRDGAHMPRRETRPMDATSLAYRLSHGDGLVRVSLAGILDREGCHEMMRRVTLQLRGRGRQVILDGRGLMHMDYRCVQPLVRWSRGLRSYGHCLQLVGWSAYLEAILAMEDWDRELERGSGLPHGWTIVAGRQHACPGAQG